MSGIVKYRAARYENIIREVCVERETQSSIWVDGLMRSKVTRYVSYHDTWQEARDYLVSAAKTKIESLEHEIASARRHLDAVSALKPPAHEGMEG